MDENAVRSELVTLKASVNRLASLLALATDVITVRAGDNLQKMLDLGGNLLLETGATFEGTYVLKSGCRLVGQAGSTVSGVTGPALVIPPGQHDIFVQSLTLSSKHPEVVTIGENSDDQTRIGQVPHHITFDKVRIPTHRGKRAFAIHGADVVLSSCEVFDCWDLGGQDSQAIYIGNTPGPVTVEWGLYSAGSSIVLAGGDTMKIVGVVPRNLMFDTVKMFRPPSWMTDGIARKVKNIFELKNGSDVIVKNCWLDGCWQDGQQGEAFMLTPALDGASASQGLKSGEVQNIEIFGCQITNVSSGFNIMGRHYQSYTPTRLTGLIVRATQLWANAAKYGGRGQLALITAEPGSIVFDQMTVINDGSSLILYDPGDVLDPVTKQKRKGELIGHLELTNSRANLGEYGLMLGGNTNARNWQVSCTELKVDGNTFGGGLMSLPNNTYQTAPYTS